MDQAAARQPDHGQFIFLGTGPVFDKIDKLIVLLGQLGWNAVPPYPDPENDLIEACLEKSCS